MLSITCSTDPPDFRDTNMICPPPPTPPVSSKMNFSYVDVPMCPGSIANYTCIAGGINAFQVPDSPRYSEGLHFKKIKNVNNKTANNEGHLHVGYGETNYSKH